MVVCTLKSPVVHAYDINYNIGLLKKNIKYSLLLQPLNYEDSPQKNVTVIVENEIPYYSCKVVSRHTTGLWELVTTSDFSGLSGKGITISLSSYHVTVTVEDVNESPVFDKPNKQVKLVENVAVGQYLETFTARDPDSQNTFV